MEIVKNFFQIQILLETLDSVYYSTDFQIKNLTKKYLNDLKLKAEPVLNHMYLSNRKLYEKITSELRI